MIKNMNKENLKMLKATHKENLKILRTNFVMEKENLQTKLNLRS